MSGKEDDLESLMSHLGEFGKYQLYQIILLVLTSLTTGIHTLSIVPILGIPNHRCQVPWLENGTNLPWDSPTARAAIPLNPDGSYSSCLLINPTTNLTEACTSWVYDRTTFKDTRTVEWDLVCDKKWLGALSKSIFMLGVFAGSIILGYLADKYGRKKTQCWTQTIQLVISIGIAFINNYNAYLVASFFYGMFGSACAYIPAFVIAMELVGPTKRTACGLVFTAMFASGVMIVAVWAYFITSYVTLQAVIGLHVLLTIGHWWLIDESPRWLWSQGRIAESVDIVAKAVKFNGGDEVDRAHYLSKGKVKTVSAETISSAGFLDLFKTPRLRLRMIYLSYNWFADSVAYYGLSLASDSMVGNPFFILFVLGLVEIPCVLIVILLLDRTGRRSLTSVMLLLAGLSCTVIALIPKDMPNVITAVACLGKFCVCGGFSTIFNYSAELLPTVVRNTGIGFCSACARVAAMLCPLILLLDTIDKSLPTLIFALAAFTSGFFTLFLPETLNKPMPESLEDGENFGLGDTAFNACYSRKKTDDYKPANPI
ncbi:organic cation transporter protein [Halyomorpha halys]|uniref:organic cation transporter protein n=1 Tax=Halyomorpha halys TaxID=286706 RepID=UPI0006D522A8|nr:organic cation transporter protein-like [Halyomorpha halys]